MPLIRARLLSLLAEVLVAIAIVAAVLAYAEFGPFAWMPPVRWSVLALITGWLFWTTAREYRHYWSRRSFWLTLGGILAAHLGVWSAVLLIVREWGILWFVPPLILEAGGLILVLSRLGFRPGGNKGKGLK